MKNPKRLTAFIIAALMLCSSAGAWAYEFPNSFWPMNDGFEAAAAADDVYGIINYGVQSINLMETQPQNQDTMSVLGSRTYEVANAYERIGDYEAAAFYYEKYLPYGNYFGWTDGVKIAQSKISALPSTLDLYTLTDRPVIYYGAKNEPASGTLFGQISETSKANESMVLAYQEYGDTSTLNWLERVMLKDASASGKAVELALNFPGEGSQLDSIISDTSFINRFCRILAEYKDLPIYLRIGAEMNVWNDRADAGKYIAAFRKIAQAARDASTNVATVWSVAHTSPIDIDMNVFYPGDEYVDWVGISAYAVRYFQGRQWSETESYNEIYFKSGDGADPVRLVKDVVERYGDRKPIMLAECGSARYTRGEVYAESEEWARLNMLRMYSTVLMAYPQVKLIAYFNKSTPDEAQDYDMAGSPSMEAAFNSITSRPWFIQKGDSSAKSFKPIGDTIYASGGSLDLYALPYTFKDQQPRVDYYIDGAWAGAAAELPYGAYLDVSALTDGTHTLEAVVTSNGTERIRKSYSLVKTSSGSDIGGSNISGTDDGGIFNDISSLSRTQQKAVEFVYNKGIVNGYEDGSFRPYANITRAEFSAMICRGFGYEPKENCSFSDAKDHWASPYIKACVDIGAINGVGGGLFAPEEYVTTDQAAKILTICAGFASTNTAYPNGFMIAARNNGIFDYTENTGIEVPLSRTDAAAMFYGALK